MLKYYLDALKKYTQFSGRATRKEFWMFFLANMLIIFGLIVIDAGFFGNHNPQESILVSIYNLATIVPYLAISVRRMHDVGRSGWFVLVPLYNLILLISSGDNNENKYGSVPVVNN